MKPSIFIAALGFGVFLVLVSGRTTHAQTPVTIQIDAAARRHAISPLIYGVCFADAKQLEALNFTIDRQGGNNFTRYNWQQDTLNIDNDWFFESIPGFSLGQPDSLVPGEKADSFIADARAAGAQPMISIPMIGWVAKVAASKTTVSSFSVAKYGPQQKTDPYDADAGNGVKPDGTFVTGNDPNDADVPSDVDFQGQWVHHLVSRWGLSTHGGVPYFLMDNEPGIWHATHRDVHPVGVTSDEYLKDFLGYASMVKSIDPGAKVGAPEEWGFPGFAASGFDQQYSGAHNYTGHPDKDAHGGMDFMPWLLTKIHEHDQRTGKRLLDIFTFHMYPQAGDFGDDVSEPMQLMRNRDTRGLWDPAYVDEDWIHQPVMLIPRMRKLVDTCYPGTKIGITEYNWGAEKNINGATAQADILGIFGREDVDLATRWTVPDISTPTFKAMQMYRSYDGHKSTFGDTSVSDRPDADANQLSSFASVRRVDGALTIMMINKNLHDPQPVSVSISHFAPGPHAEVWQLTAANTITHEPDVSVSQGRLQSVLPAQSITLFVVPRGGS
jgi:hypothetical protein